METNLSKLKTETLKIEEAATLACVTPDTIRNWIKNGYLISHDKKTVTLKSFNDFMENIAGIEKLKSRANKLFKKDIPTPELSSQIDLIIKNFTGEELGIKYQESLPNSYRNREGIYYTPSWIVRDMLSKLKVKPHFKFLDPCCGSGNFIIEAIKAGIDPENIYGFDTDENAVIITKERIYREWGFKSKNIMACNFLEYAPSLKKENITFDLIFTNPPWGKKIPKAERQKYASFFQCGNSIDTSSLFMAACLELLNSSGILGFLLQEAFFNIASYEEIRAKLLERKILYLTDYGKAFKGLMSKAQAIIVKNQSPSPESQIECLYSNYSFTRQQSSFASNPKKIFNFWTKEDEAKIIERLYSINHITLQGRAKWALGIVTGSNKKFCSTLQLDGYLPVYKGSDISKEGFKEPTIFIQPDFSKFQQVAPLELYMAKEKLIYRFISSNLCFAYDDKQRLILNSANLLIPINLGISAKELSYLLNSEILNWLFKKLFNTHKILRRDLELLPIHIDYFKEYEKFSEENYLNYLGIEKIKDGSYKISA